MNIDQLFAVPGALAAFTFTDKGDLTAHKIKEGEDINPRMLDLLAHTCIANMAVATLEARGWESLTGQKGFEPLQGFSMIGLEWSAVVNSNGGVIVKNQDTDYEAAFAALNA
jgi:roadblock/LC7 domain-containing protein